MSVSPARNMLEKRLIVKDGPAHRLLRRTKNTTIEALLIDREYILAVVDQLSDRIELLRIERDNAYEEASQKHQAEMAKLRGRLAVAENAKIEQGRKGGRARAFKLSPAQRSEQASNAAKARWSRDAGT